MELIPLFIFLYLFGTMFSFAAAMSFESRNWPMVYTLIWPLVLIVYILIWILEALVILFKSAYQSIKEIFQ